MEYRRKIQSFTDLEAWKEGHKLVLEIYEITKKFPNEEKFGLVSQLRRATISITSNIAEGFRRETYKEKVRFYSMSLSSLSEVQNQLLIARDVNYIKNKEFQMPAIQSVVTSKLIGGLVRSSKKKS